MSNRSFNICLFRLFDKIRVIVPLQRLQPCTDPVQPGTEADTRRGRRPCDLNIDYLTSFPVSIAVNTPNCFASGAIKLCEASKSSQKSTQTLDWPISDHLNLLLSKTLKECAQNEDVLDLCTDSEGVLMAYWSFRFASYHVK